MPPSLWIDATHGAAGDMLLAALLDAGASIEQVRSHISQLAAEPVGLQLTEVRRHGLRASYVRVLAPETAVQRRLGDVLRLIEAAGLPPVVSAFATKVFGSLAAAESHAHGVEPEEVHFHEVGALDALADIVGCGSALHSLGFLPDGGPTVAGVSRPRVVVSRIAVGAGEARTAHGIFPLPAPAVLALLAEVHAPMSGGGQARELCTPTGAALLASIASEWGDLPAMTVTVAGTGAGTADPDDYPNILRVVVGETVESDTGRVGRADDLVMVESTIDDLDPRLWPDVLDALYHAGALDAWATPVLMRKGRPGYIVAALAPPERVSGVFTALVTHTTTLGARLNPVVRRALNRDHVVVGIDGVTVNVKRGLLAGQVVTAQPEYADVVAASTELGLPVRVVLERVRATATSLDARTRKGVTESYCKRRCT